MIDKSKAELRGVDREGSTARTEAPASPQIAGPSLGALLLTANEAQDILNGLVDHDVLDDATIEKLRTISMTQGPWPPSETDATSEDAARLDWLQARGRVKARKYGNMKDDWKWDLTDPFDLRRAIDAQIDWENSPQCALSRSDMPPELSDV